MSDSISREVAIGAVKRLLLGETDATRLAMRIGDYLKRVPSAQPEIIRCKDCKYYQTEQCYMHIERLWELKPDDYCSQGERDE